MLKDILKSSDQRKVFLLLALIIAVVYIQVLQFDFVNWDDNTNIQSNPEIIFAGLSSYWAYWKGVYAGLYVPVPFTIWTFVGQISQFIFREPQPLPFFYHAINVLVHIANTSLVFALLYFLLGEPEKPKQKKSVVPANENGRLWAAGLAAAIFAMHPMQVESVAWATGLKDLIFGFFALLTLHYILRNKMRTASIAYLAGLLSKPTAIILPFLAVPLLLESKQKITREKIYFFGAWLLIAIPDFIVTKSTQSEAIVRFFPDFWQKLIVAYDAVSFYLSKFIFPYPLATDYGRNPQFVLENDWPNWTWILLSAFILCMVTPWVRRLRVPQGFAFAMITVLPVLGLVAFSYQVTCTVADRYMYLGLIGFCIPIARAIYTFPQRFVKPAVLGLIAIYSALTFAQAQTWQNSEALFSNVLEHFPASRVARTQIGIFRVDQQKYEAALPLYFEQLKIYPDDILSYIGLAKIYQKKGHLQEAVKTLETSLKYYEKFADTHTLLAEILIDMGRIEEAEKHLARTREFDPNNYEVSYLEGNIAAQRQDYPLAEKKYLDAISYYPTFPEAHNNLGNTMAIMKNLQGAQLHFRIAAKLSPNFTAAHLNFARSLLMTGNFPEAYQQLKYVLHLEPNHKEAQALLEKMQSRLRGYN
jgi:tetratricopeptide (TPR) repeat protein